MNQYYKLPDDGLISLLKQDDEKAFAALYDRYWDKIYTVACHRLKIPEQAEEIVQDIFVKLWEHRATLQLRHSLSTYLAVAVKYRVINFLDHLYSVRNRMAELPDYSQQMSSSPEELFFEQELRDQIEATVKRLPEKCQMIFRMSREQGMSNKEIAHELSISESTVENHINRALKDVRSNFSIIVPFAIMVLLQQDKFHH